MKANAVLEMAKTVWNWLTHAIRVVFFEKLLGLDTLEAIHIEFNAIAHLQFGALTL